MKKIEVPVVKSFSEAVDCGFIVKKEIDNGEREVYETIEPFAIERNGYISFFNYGERILPSQITEYGRVMQNSREFLNILYFERDIRLKEKG